MKTDYDLLQNLRFGASVFVGQNKNDSYLSDTDVFTNPSRYTRTVNPYLNAYNPDGSYVYDPDMTVNTAMPTCSISTSWRSAPARSTRSRPVRSRRSSTWITVR